MTEKQEPSFTQADLQHAVRDLNEVFGTKQKHVAKKEQIIDFIVTTMAAAFGPDPDNPGQTIWVHGKERNPTDQTVATYEALMDAGFGPKAEQEPAAAATEPESQPETSTAAGASEPEATSSAEPEPEAAAAEPEPEAGESKECPDFGKPLNKAKDEGYDPDSPDCQPDSCKRVTECAAAVVESGKAGKGSGGKKKANTAAAPAKERYGYVHAAHDAIIEMDATRDDLAKKVLELYVAKGGTGDLKQARRNLDTDLRSLLVFGVVKEEGGKIILVNRK